MGNDWDNPTEEEEEEVDKMDEDEINLIYEKVRPSFTLIHLPLI